MTYQEAENKFKEESVEMTDLMSKRPPILN